MEGNIESCMREVMSGIGFMTVLKEYRAWNREQRIMM